MGIEVTHSAIVGAHGRGGEIYGARTPVTTTFTVLHAALQTVCGWAAKDAEKLSSFHRLGLVKIPRTATVLGAKLLCPSAGNLIAAGDSMRFRVGILSNEYIHAAWNVIGPKAGRGIQFGGWATDWYQAGSGPPSVPHARSMGPPDVGGNRATGFYSLLGGIGSDIFGFWQIAEATVTGTVATIHAHFTREDDSAGFPQPGHRWYIEIYNTVGTAQDARPGTTLLATTDHVPYADLPRISDFDAGTIAGRFPFADGFAVTAGTLYAMRLWHTDHRHRVVQLPTIVRATPFLPFGSAEPGGFFDDADRGFDISQYPLAHMLPYPTPDDGDTIDTPAILHDGVFATGIVTVPFGQWQLGTTKTIGDGSYAVDHTVGLTELLQSWIDRAEYVEDDVLAVILDPFDYASTGATSLISIVIESSTDPAETGVQLVVDYVLPGDPRARVRFRPAVGAASRVRSAVGAGLRVRPAVGAGVRVQPAVAARTNMRLAVAAIVRIGTMDNILIGSDNLWEVLGPVDVASAAGISAPSAITGRLFDDQADTSCSVDAASAQKDLDVAHPEHFANGDSASIVLDDGTVQVNVVVSSAGSTLTLTDNLTDTVAAGNQVAKKIGADVTISTTNFGVVTAVEGDPTWGYRGTIPNTQAGFTHGMRVRGEATFNGGAGLLVVLTQHATAFLPSLGEPPP